MAENKTKLLDHHNTEHFLTVKCNFCGERKFFLTY